jgi:hypothetical protein
VLRHVRSYVFRIRIRIRIRIRTPAPPFAASTVQHPGIPQLPQPLMGGDQAFLGPALSSGRQIRRPVNHELQHGQQFRRDLDVCLVACVMEGDEDLVG